MKIIKSTTALLFSAFIFASCNNSSEEAKTNSKDSVSADSPLMDAQNTSDSVNKKIEDSTHMKHDSMMKK